MHGYWVFLLACVLWITFSHGTPRGQSPFVNQSLYNITGSGHIPWSECPSPNVRPVLRVAIIGAGVSGTSSAYFLSEAQKKLNHLRLKGMHGCSNSTLPENIYVTVYERTNRVGGRVCSIHPLHDSDIAPVDIGASIYAEINQNMVRAVQAMRLKSIPRETLPNSRLGLWDGNEFVYDNFKGSKWDYWKLYWRYGTSLRTLMDLLDHTTSQFLQTYSPEFLHRRKTSQQTKSGYPWSHLAEFMDSLGIRDLGQSSAYEYFVENKVSPLFAEEMISAATRANYAQSVEQIHAFSGLVAMKADNAFSIRGGNEQLFQRLLNDSGALLRLNTQGDVTGIMRMNSAEQERSPEWWVATRDGHGGVFDVVILAAPWDQSSMALLNTEKRIPHMHFKTVHVTLVATDASHVDPNYFGYKGSNRNLPQVIVTTNHHGSTKPEFLSLSYIRRLSRVFYAGKKWPKLYIVKILSEQELADQRIQALFGSASVLWTSRHVWDAYPELTPTTHWGPFEVDDNLFYTNSMERLVSTMETSMVAAKNVATLVLQKWLGLQFVHGHDCRWDNASTFSKGWDLWGCKGS